MTRRKPFDDTLQTLSPATKTRLAGNPWLLAVVLAVVTFVAYQPTWRAGFIWDDDDHLTANPAMTTPHGLKMIWSSLSTSRYYPLTLTTFWVQRRLWGLNPRPYHLMNILLHVANGCLIFFILRRLRIPLAWLAALIWALHPVNVESVAWITELKNTQSGFFFFLSVFCFLRFDAEKEHGWYALAIVCGLAAMISKPSTVVLPLVLLLCVWWERGRWKLADYIWTAPFFGLAAGMSALTVIEQRGHILRAGTSEWHLMPAKRLVIAGKAVWFYAARVLWPGRLVFVYPRWEVDVSSLWSWVPTAALVVLGVTFWRCRSRAWSRAVLFGGGFFIVALLPVLGFFDVFYFRYSFVADHFQYLACIGLISLAVSIGAAICERAGRWGRGLGMLGAAIVLLSLGMSTWSRAHIYQNDETLWRDTLAKNPQCWLAHNNLGFALFKQGRTTEAMGQYEQALRLKPDLVEAHNNLGNALFKLGQTSEAVAQYQETLRIKPDFADARYNLGNALVKLGKVEEAVAQYQEALRIKPDYTDAHHSLGYALLQLGRAQEAIGHLKWWLQTDPDDAVARTRLGLALFQVGKASDAIDELEQALRLKPDLTEAQNNLAWLLATLPQAGGGDPVRAVSLARRACELTGNHAADDLDTLAVAYAATGRFDDAVTTAQKAIDVARSDGEAALVKEIGTRLELYHNRRAYGQTNGVTGSGNR